MTDLICSNENWYETFGDSGGVPGVNERVESLRGQLTVPFIFYILSYYLHCLTFPRPFAPSLYLLLFPFILLPIFYLCVCVCILFPRSVPPSVCVSVSVSRSQLTLLCQSVCLSVCLYCFPVPASLICVCLKGKILAQLFVFYTHCLAQYDPIILFLTHTSLHLFWLSKILYVLTHFWLNKSDQSYATSPVLQNP